jgi:L-fuconolactonase
MRIDAHQHFWQRSLPLDYRWLEKPENRPIRRDFLPADLAPHLAATGIERSIFVQTQHNIEENRWALRLAEEHNFVIGVVGWIDLAGTQCERQLLEFKGHPKFVGVRHITQDEPDDDFIIGDQVLRGLRTLERHGVPLDLLFYVKHLRHAATLARRLPDLPMVIDHLAKPRIKDQSFDDWQPHFRAAAEFPNIYCKLSGMVTEADWRQWKAADLKPYVQAALECFGPKRLMFGSDWPVCELAASYEQVVAALDEALGPISTTERERIFGGTAREFYQLAVV